ncbi:killer cell lectin-like receptor subfamily F member 1 [Balearica regulorum gibbericeps]|uniref:killer cell lectin-like receptor subfamily F member 1 n=1 Tax=Balearica regulorum gibbericeps TaxID=100784 RepID=UPI003F60F457
MAGDITYVDVAMLPRERPQIPSRTSVSGNLITYAELRVKPKPKGSSRSETSSSGCRHRRSAWFYAALALGVLVLVLLGIIAVLAKQFSKDRAGKSESLPHYLNNTGNHISSEKTVLAVPLKWLVEELCEDGRRICELCPPGWQLHRSRCYYFSEDAVSWHDSERNCLARKSQLLDIEDEIEMEFIDNKEKDTKYIWIGTKIEDIKIQWTSAEDPGVKENRIPINRIETDKNCAVYRRKNMIQADNCQTSKKWICKKNATLLML